MERLSSCRSVTPKSKNTSTYSNLKILKENLHDSIAVYGDPFFSDVFTVANVNASSGRILFFM